MKVLAVGGGSGGHVTPVVAVLRELRDVHPDIELRVWCDRKFAPQAKAIVKGFDATIPVDIIVSGKFRRYHSLPVWRQLLRPVSIVLPNIWDGCKVVAGIAQSIVKLIRFHPDVVFSKGGYVCLPVGLAARILRIPLVIHDSDAHPGLTNRILSRFATRIATGAPLENYSYPTDRSVYVGIPVSAEFARRTESERLQIKRSLGFSPDEPLILITGGGLGARRINDAVASELHNILHLGSVILVSGVSQYQSLRTTLPSNNPNFRLIDFVSKGMADYLAAADIVVTRAGATTIAELAALAKATILIPNAFLTGGHQVKNAKVYAEKGAVAIVNDDQLFANPALLTHAIASLLQDAVARQRMEEAFYSFSRPNAARDMASMIFESIGKR